MAKKSKLELLIELSDKLFNNKLSSAQQKLSTATDKMQGKLNKLRMPELNTKGFEKLESFNFGIGAGIGMGVVNTVSSGISSLGKEAITSVDALTKFDDTMKFGGFDPTAINIAKDALKKYADDTVYDLKTTSNTVAQLAANGVKDYTGLTQAAGNLNAVAGGNADTFKSVALVLTQTAGAGKLTTENWNQMANAIPGASGKLQEALLKNGAFTGNFREAMEKGMITADEFNKALMDLGNDPIAVEAAKSTKTFEGAIGQMQAGVVDAFSNILQSIGIDNLTAGINTLGEITQTALQPFIWFFRELRNGNPIVMHLITIIGMLAAAFGGYQLVVGGITLVTKIWTGVQMALNAVLTANPIGLVVAGIAALIALVVLAYNKLGWFRGAVDGAWEALKGFGTVIKEYVINRFKELLAGITGIGGALLKFFKGDWQGAWDAGKTAVSNLLGVDSKTKAIAGLKTVGKNAALAYADGVASVDAKLRTKTNNLNPETGQTQSLYKTPTNNTATKETKKGGKKIGDNVEKVAGKANQVRNVTVQFEAFNKGDINVSQSQFKGMTLAEVEAYFKEMFMRVIANT